MNSIVKRVLGIASAVFLSSISFGYSGGSGTTDAPYQIADADDLLELAADTGNYDKYFILTADIDLAGYSFTTAVIAPNTDDNSTVFTGTFNGNYHVISSLTIDTQGQNQGYLGLFGNIQSSTIKRLGLKNVSVTCGDESAYVGTLAGLNQGTIDQCYAKGAIHGGVSPQNLGGFVGASAGTVTNCHADVDVYAGASAQILGGFAGTAYGVLSNCYASGFVDSRASAGGFGGIIHPWFSLLLNCYFLSPGDGGGPNNGIGTLLSDSQMRQQSSFVGWDFQGSAADGEEEVWQMNGGYPVLAWQVPVGMRQLVVLSRYWQATGCISGQPCVIADWYDDNVIDTKDLALLVQSWLEPAIQTDYPKTEDNFETGDFTKLPWVQGGNAGWTIVSCSNVYDGLYSAKSGAIGHSQSSTLELTAAVSGKSEIVFAVKVSSESGFDKLDFYIDGSIRLMGLSGEYGWNEMRFSGFSDGVHTFKWSYSKDSSGIGGSDCAWIDNVRILRLEE
ncbi:MAG: hypothetical protein FJ263_05360 [Planctomycetes bacterium]|nr:hypothetical protein [Planctomycetota bacterium]